MIPRCVAQSSRYSRSTGSGSSTIAASAASLNPALRNESTISCLLYCTTITLHPEKGCSWQVRAYGSLLADAAKGQRSPDRA